MEKGRSPEAKRFYIVGLKVESNRSFHTRSIVLSLHKHHQTAPVVGLGAIRVLLNGNIQSTQSQIVLSNPRVRHSQFDVESGIVETFIDSRLVVTNGIVWLVHHRVNQATT